MTDYELDNCLNHLAQRKLNDKLGEDYYIGFIYGLLSREAICKDNPAAMRNIAKAKDAVKTIIAELRLIAAGE